MKQNCLQNNIVEKEIQRDRAGFITNACLKDMQNNLPIVLVSKFTNPEHCWTANNTSELELYLFSSLFIPIDYYRYKTI